MQSARLCLILGTALLAACAGPVSRYESAPAASQQELKTAMHPPPQPSAPIATIDVAVASPGPTIPPDFDGVSIEVDDAANKYLGVQGAPNTVFEQFLRNLGRGLIRVGGASTDYSCWNPASAPYPQGCLFTIDQPALNGYLQASADTGWSMTLGVNLAQNSGSWALEYGVAAAAAASQTSGSSLAGFEFGNEPDLYSRQVLFDHHPIRPKNYAWQNLVSDWSSYVSAFKNEAQTSGYALVGPVYDEAAAWRDSYFGPFIQGVGRQNLGFTTLHEYPTSVCRGKTVTIAQLLSPSVISAYKTAAAGWVSVANQYGMPLDLGETNSTSCHGQKGVSDVFASAVWGLDWLFVNAELGMRRLNFHNNGMASYDPVVAYRTMQGNTIVYHDFVAPLYYAMYAFSSTAQGNATLPATVTSSANIAAYAVRDPAGDARVYVINKDLQAAGSVTVHPSASMHGAKLLFIKAPALDSKAIAYGGTTFDNATGMMRGVPKQRTVTPDAQGDYDFTLQIASIAVLTITP